MSGRLHRRPLPAIVDQSPLIKPAATPEGGCTKPVESTEAAKQLEQAKQNQAWMDQRAVSNPLRWVNGNVTRP